MDMIIKHDSSTKRDLYRYTMRMHGIWDITISVTISLYHYCDLRSPLMQQAVTLSQNFPHLTPKEKFTFLMCTSHPALIQETALYIYKAMQARSLCLSPLID